VARKTSRPKTGPSKGGKDQLTGLSLETDAYGPIKSDEIYGPNSAPLKKIRDFTGSDLGNMTMEFEMSKDRVIHTTQYIWDDGKTITYQRIVAEGSFTYTNNKMSRASISRLGSHNATVRDGTVIYEDAWIDAYTSPKSISNLKSSFEWNQALAGADITILEAEYANNPPTEPLRRSGDMRAIDSFGGGNLLQENWWLNPFAPNLI